MPNAIAQRVAPWIGIGMSGQWASSREALEASGLDFTVRKERLFWQHDDNGIVYDEPVPMFANVRDTDDMVLGCVTPQYKIIQNIDAFSIIDPFIAGKGTITNVGMTEGGLCFMVAETEVKNFGGESYNMYLMATNSFNTKYPCQVIMTPVRIICQNMYRKLIPDRVFLAKHTMTVDERLRLLNRSGILDKKMIAFGSIIESAQSRKMDLDKLKMLIAMLFPYPKEGGPRELAYKAKAEHAREEFLDVYYDAQDNIVHHDTAFGFVNAYYDYLSHRGPSRNSNMAWQDRRLQGLVSGDDIDTAVVHQALK